MSALDRVSDVFVCIWDGTCCRFVLVVQGILIEFLEGQGHFASVVGVSSAEGGSFSKHDPSEHVAQVWTHMNGVGR